MKIRTLFIGVLVMVMSLGLLLESLALSGTLGDSRDDVDGTYFFNGDSIAGASYHGVINVLTIRTL